eukprot:1143696-Pelagomonas_calceolata.AAC.2
MVPSCGLWEHWKRRHFQRALETLQASPTYECKKEQHKCKCHTGREIEQTHDCIRPPAVLTSLDTLEAVLQTTHRLDIIGHNGVGDEHEAVRHLTCTKRLHREALACKWGACGDGQHGKLQLCEPNATETEVLEHVCPRMAELPQLSSTEVVTCCVHTHQAHMLQLQQSSCRHNEMHQSCTRDGASTAAQQ